MSGVSALEYSATFMTEKSETTPLQISARNDRPTAMNCPRASAGAAAISLASLRCAPQIDRTAWAAAMTQARAIAKWPSSGIMGNALPCRLT